ncbi:MAG: hypothetical protein AAFO02_09040 [Bacteroidota bacterium]
MKLADLTDGDLISPDLSGEIAPALLPNGKRELQGHDQTNHDLAKGQAVQPGRRPDCTASRH